MRIISIPLVVAVAVCFGCAKEKEDAPPDATTSKEAAVAQPAGKQAGDPDASPELSIPPGADVIGPAPPPDDVELMIGTAIYAYDAGTVAFQPQGKREWMTVRLMGVQAPDPAGRERSGDEPWGSRAQQALTVAIARRPVRVEPALVMDEGRTVWGFLWRDEMLMNDWVLRQGHGRFVATSPNMKYEESLQAAADAAQAQGLGVFDPENPWPGPADAAP